MFLRNYDNMLMLMHFDTSFSDSYAVSYAYESRYIGSSSGWGDGYVSTKRPNGSVLGCAFGNGSSSCLMSYMASLAECNICLGDGAAEVSYEDYKLSGNVINNKKLARVSVSTVYDSDTRKFRRTATHTYTNSGDSPITISEWGIFHCFTTKTTGVEVLFSHSASDQILLYREVLDEPIVIEPGTTATLNFSIEIPMANHP